MKDEFFHINPEGDGMSGPFDTIEEAKADALEYLHDYRYRVPEIKIVKVVAVSETKVNFDTKWNDKNA